MNENNVTTAQKNSAIKTLAIIGLLTAVVVGLWLAITVIQFLPSAFKELASIADGLYGNGSAFSVAPEKNVVNSGESISVAWTNVAKNGEYAFSYHCVDGVSVEARDSKGDIAKVMCDNPIFLKPGNLKGGKETLDVVFRSEKQRFSDVLFSVGFFETGKETALYEKNAIVTVVNATIPETGIVAKPVPVVVVKPVVVAKPTVTPTAKPVVKKNTGGYYTVPVTTTTYPVSNPNGYTDLQMTLVGAGTITSRGAFLAQPSLVAGNDYAVQFIVKNIGTKTSNTWTYRVTYPGSEQSVFISRPQIPLEPGERDIITVRFTTSGMSGMSYLRGSVGVSDDANGGNNSFSQAIQIVR